MEIELKNAIIFTIFRASNVRFSDLYGLDFRNFSPLHSPKSFIERCFCLKSDESLITKTCSVIFSPLVVELLHELKNKQQQKTTTITPTTTTATTTISNIVERKLNVNLMIIVF
jgi:hypothetical protein